MTTDKFTNTGIQSLFNIVLKWIIATVLSFIWLGCTKFITIEKPNDQVVSKTVFSDDATAITALNGLYSKMMTNSLQFINGGITIYTGMSSDELYSRAAIAGYQQFQNNQIPANSGDNESNLWDAAYSPIYQMNAIIEGAQQSANLSGKVKGQLIGESKFYRALYYFYLTNLYGKVPLIISTNYSDNATKGRNSIDSIYTQIISDLTDAETTLDYEYPVINRARPNKLAASALLSRVFLYRGNWEMAEKEASLVLTNSIYQLEDSLNSVFLPNSQEVILQLYPASTAFNSTTEGQNFVPAAAASSRPTFPMRDQLFNSFESTDERKQAWIGTKIYQGITYNYPFKYKVRSTIGSPVEYNVLLRLAEQYLIRAEARAQLNELEDAISDLNKIRNRAGLPDGILGDKEMILNQILKERRVELFAELGHRWLDLKRTGRADSVLSPIKVGSWQSTDTLYPVPFNEIKLNPNLQQNEGYN